MRSLLPKFNELCLSISHFKSGLVMVTESWLTDLMNDDLFRIPNFTFYRQDRLNRRGGGVCLWVNDNILSNLHTPLHISPSSCEILFIKLRLQSRNIICCLMYIPPGLCRAEQCKISDFVLNEFDSLLSSSPHFNIIVAGDFNDFPCTVFEDDLSLRNKVNVATRENSILDKIFVDIELSELYDKFAMVGSPVSTSDHNSIILRSPVNLNDITAISVPVFDFRESHLNEFLTCLSNVDFSIIEDVNSVNVMCDYLFESIYSCMSAIPYEMVTITSRDKPWITPLLKLLLNRRWDAFRRRDWTMYEHYKMKVKTGIIKAKNDWAMRHRHNVNGLWKVVKEVKGSSASNPFLHLRSTFASNHDLIEAFTCEFRKNFNQSSDVDLLPLNEKLWNFTISERDVLHGLNRLDVGKSSGPDSIPTKLLKVGAYVLCRPLCAIFNRSLQTQTFPDLFKIAFVQPIPKKAHPKINDFRPISVTPVLAKLFERLVLGGIKDHLISHYGGNQHAYRPYGSTTSALVDIHDRVTFFLDQKETIAVRVACLDISKAFDRLHFNRLLNFLNVSGVDHGFLRWLKSFLSGRCFRVRINNDFGPKVCATSGVPQGSVLGPFLFASFMSQIDFDSSLVHTVKYADDITIIERIESASQKCLSTSSINEAFTNAGLTLNVKKCHELVIQKSFLPQNIVTSCVFDRVSRLRVLGFIFSDSLSWNFQISDVIKRVSQRLFIIRCLKDVLSRKELIIVYHAIITSLLMYASPTYGNLPKGLLCKLEQFHKRAHRLICGNDCNCDSFHSISSLFIERGLSFLYCCENHSSHPLHHLVPERLPRTGKLKLSYCMTSRRLNTFFPWICVVSNGIAL